MHSHTHTYTHMHTCTCTHAERAHTAQVLELLSDDIAPPCRAASRLFAAHCWTREQTFNIPSHVRDAVDDAKQPAGYIFATLDVPVVRNRMFGMDCVANAGCVSAPAPPTLPQILS